MTPPEDQKDRVRPFVDRAPVGKGRTWGEVSPGDRFVFPDGTVLTVKCRRKHSVVFEGDGPMAEPINVVHNISPVAVYERPTDA